MQTYTIIIDEEQRAMLARLLEAIGHPSGEEALFLGMLQDLPKDEAESPGALHGFCI